MSRRLMSGCKNNQSTRIQYDTMRKFNSWKFILNHNDGFLNLNASQI